MTQETTESGLKITILKNGEGESPKMGQTVMMHYELWANEGVTSSLYDYDKKEYVDDIFYSTYDEKNPFSGPIPIKIGSSTPKDDIYSKGESIEGLDKALMSTKNMEAKVGRAKFLDTKGIGITDPGAFSTTLILKEFFKEFVNEKNN